VTAPTVLASRAIAQAAPLPRDWRDHAECRHEDGDLFYPAGTTGQFLDQIEEAKAVCRRCPVMETCLDWALQTGEPHGIHGGMTEGERRVLLRRERRRMAGPHNNPELAWVQILRDRRPEFMALEAADCSVQEIAMAMGTNGQTVYNVRRALEAERSAAAGVEAVAA
jgi:WhiB family redox-sensing transcriptional regulator